MSKRFAVLRLRDLRLVFGASVVSNLGDGVVGVALAFAVLDLTGSATDLGLVIAARTIAQVAALLIGGVVADRVSRRGLMVTADLVRFGGQALVGALLLAGDATLLEVIASQVVIGAAGGFFNPAAQGLMPAVAGEHLQEANALNGIAGAGSGIIGPAIGGVLVVAVGPSWALVVDALSYGGSALFLLGVSRAAAARGATDRAPTSFLSDLRGGFQEVRSRTWVWSMILAFGISNALAGSWEVLGPLICREHYGGAAAFALLSSISAVGSVAGGAVLLRFKPRHPLRVGVLVCVPFVVPNFLLAAHAPLLAVVPFSLLAGAGPLVFNTLWWTALQQHVPPESISRVISYDFAGSYALQPFGYALAGPLAVALGVPGALVLVAAVAIVVNAATLLIGDIRNLEAVVATPGPSDPVIVEA